MKKIPSLRFPVLIFLGELYGKLFVSFHQRMIPDIHGQGNTVPVFRNSWYDGNRQTEKMRRMAL
jgi:hypothetical protein